MKIKELLKHPISSGLILRLLTPVVMAIGGIILAKFTTVFQSIFSSFKEYTTFYIIGILCLIILILLILLIKKQTQQKNKPRKRKYVTKIRNKKALDFFTNLSEEKRGEYFYLYWFPLNSTMNTPNFYLLHDQVIERINSLVPMQKLQENYILEYFEIGFNGYYQLNEEIYNLLEKFLTASIAEGMDDEQKDKFQFIKESDFRNLIGPRDILTR